MNLELGRVIRQLRTEHAVTQEELADYLDISFQAVSKWETGTTLPDITLLPKLAAFFGVRIDGGAEAGNYLIETKRIDK